MASNRGSMLIGAAIATGVLLLLAGGVLAWLLLSADDKRDTPAGADVAATQPRTDATPAGNAVNIVETPQATPTIAPGSIPIPTPSPSSSASPSPAASGLIPAGSYAGTYLCAQGWTDVTLDFTPPSGGSQRARTRFGGNLGVPRGSYTLTVEPQGNGRFYLRPLRWEQRPPGYVMVGLTVSVDGRRIGGKVDPPCGEIRVERVG
ncbi:hypothetical protein [Sphingomonas sanxanigenens]|uniref:Uncharacterized protein n=1 Tax=Sphingomonas sanxanigenens DSM 19645 = NX02 TaxID=1123269 RepID=W0AHF7_9SPHN|nr:hypothetical protein [Sphingomonas sanxanigenens]AHE57349.1 hypothetical protein NX02_28900 [Sphingomonas sanxanigenens DSM 19645 = NX02]